MPANLRIQEVSKLSAHSQQLQVPSNASLSTNHATPATPLICFDSNLQSERQSDACRNQDLKTCEALAANGAGEQPRTIEQPLRCPGSALDTLGSRTSPCLCVSAKATTELSTAAFQPHGSMMLGISAAGMDLVLSDFHSSTVWTARPNGGVSAAPSISWHLRVTATQVVAIVNKFLVGLVALGQVSLILSATHYGCEWLFQTGG